MKLKEENFGHNDSITAVSKHQLDVHVQIYKGYIPKINEIHETLANDPQWPKSNSIYSHFRGLKLEESFALDAIILHELYFTNMGGHERGPLTETMSVLESCFGGFGAFKEDFIATATAARGWCVLGYEQRSGQYMNMLQDTHNQGVFTASHPVLVLDVYEHAYFIDYPNKKADYIKAFMDNINWAEVEKRVCIVNESKKAHEQGRMTFA